MAVSMDVAEFDASIVPLEQNFGLDSGKLQISDDDNNNVTSKKPTDKKYVNDRGRVAKEGNRNNIIEIDLEEKNIDEPLKLVTEDVPELTQREQEPTSTLESYEYDVITQDVSDNVCNQAKKKTAIEKKIDADALGKFTNIGINVAERELSQRESAFQSTSAQQKVISDEEQKMQNVATNSVSEESSVYEPSGKNIGRLLDDTSINEDMHKPDIACAQIQKNIGEVDGLEVKCGDLNCSSFAILSDFIKAETLHHAQNGSNKTTISQVQANLTGEMQENVGNKLGQNMSVNFSNGSTNSEKSPVFGDMANILDINTRCSNTSGGIEDASEAMKDVIDVLSKVVIDVCHLPVSDKGVVINRSVTQLFTNSTNSCPTMDVTQEKTCEQDLSKCTRQALVVHGTDGSEPVNRSTSMHGIDHNYVAKVPEIHVYSSASGAEHICDTADNGGQHCDMCLLNDDNDVQKQHAIWSDSVKEQYNLNDQPNGPEDSTILNDEELDIASMIVLSEINEGYGEHSTSLDLADQLIQETGDSNCTKYNSVLEMDEGMTISDRLDMANMHIKKATDLVIRFAEVYLDVIDELPGLFSCIINQLNIVLCDFQKDENYSAKRKVEKATNILSGLYHKLIGQNCFCALASVAEDYINVEKKSLLSNVTDILEELEMIQLADLMTETDKLLLQLTMLMPEPASPTTNDTMISSLEEGELEDSTITVDNVDEVPNSRLGIRKRTPRKRSFPRVSFNRNQNHLQGSTTEEENHDSSKNLSDTFGKAKESNFGAVHRSKNQKHAKKGKSEKNECNLPDISSKKDKHGLPRKHFKRSSGKSGRKGRKSESDAGTFQRDDALMNRNVQNSKTDHCQVAKNVMSDSEISNLSSKTKRDDRNGNKQRMTRKQLEIKPNEQDPPKKVSRNDTSSSSTLRSPDVNPLNTQRKKTKHRQVSYQRNLIYVQVENTDNCEDIMERDEIKEIYGTVEVKKEHALLGALYLTADEREYYREIQEMKKQSTMHFLRCEIATEVDKHRKRQLLKDLKQEKRQNLIPPKLIDGSLSKFQRRELIWHLGGEKTDKKRLGMKIWRLIGKHKLLLSWMVKTTGDDEAIKKKSKLIVDSEWDLYSQFVGNIEQTARLQ